VLLSVLSGELTVSEAIAQAKISRATYYQLETKALAGMLQALQPILEAGARSPGKGRLEQLQSRLEHLLREKRRLQRLLLLSRKAARIPLTTGCRGRLPKRPLDSNPAGSSAWPRSRAKRQQKQEKSCCEELASPTRERGEPSP
jgi:hypothetical protein